MDHPTVTRHPRLRRLAGTVVAAAAIAALAPAATAGAIEPSRLDHSCFIHYDLKIGPLKGGRAEGHCPQDAGRYYHGPNIPDHWSLGVVYLPDGTMYSAGVDNVLNLPPRDIPIPHL